MSEQQSIQTKIKIEKCSRNSVTFITWPGNYLRFASYRYVHVVEHFDITPYEEQTLYRGSPITREAVPSEVLKFHREG